MIRLPDRAQLLDRLAQAITRMLATDAPTVARLRALDGRVMALRLSGFATGLYVAVVDGGLLLATTTLRPPDVTLEGRLADFLAFARARQAREAPGAGKLRIQGDLGTAQAVQRVLDELAIDWEELLVPYLGDVVAHQLGRGMREGLAWLTATRAALGADVTDYLQRETRMLPTQREAEALARAGVRLIGDVDRLAARVARLRERRDPK